MPRPMSIGFGSGDSPVEPKLNVSAIFGREVVGLGLGLGMRLALVLDGLLGGAVGGALVAAVAEATEKASNGGDDNDDGEHYENCPK